MTGMSWRKALCALMLFLGMSGAVIAEPAVQRVLFVGNSLTYVNSLPAIFEQVAQAQPGGMRYRADMYVQGGATLAQHDKEPALHALLDSGNYQVVVLQERGGNDLCVRPANHWHGDEASCDALIAAHLALAREASAHGARVLYMGTYQGTPPVSAELVGSEAELSQRMGATHLEISDTLLRMQGDHPAYPWLYEDHSHPGMALTTLMALRTYGALNPHQPLHAFDLCTTADLYTTKLRGHAFVDHDEMTAPTKPERCLLDKTQVQAIIDGVRRSS